MNHQFDATLAMSAELETTGTTLSDRLHEYIQSIQG